MEPDLALTYYLILFIFFAYLVAFHMGRISSFSSSPSTSPLGPSSINDLVTEIGDFSFYHHLSRPRRWSNPEIASDREGRWREAPRSEQAKERYTTRFISPFRESKFPWGYIIYWTVYTSASDKQWPLALKKLDWALIYGIDSDLASAQRKSEDMDYSSIEPEPEPESTPERLVKESRKHVVFSNKRSWDRAPIEQIRAHFKQYLRASQGQGYGRLEGCLVAGG